MGQLSWSRLLLQQYLKDQYFAAKIKMEKQIWIFAFLATFVKENVGSMSKEITKEKSQEQENLHNSWAYNTYETLTHSSSISTGKSLSEALIFASTNPPNRKILH